MVYLIVGTAIFIGIHSVSIINEPWRDAMAAKLGENTWKAIYSVIAIAGFVLLIYGYGVARQDPIVLYQTPAWMRYVSYVLMLFVFPLFVASNMPGKIAAAAKHPLLAATKIWAFSHLLVNGTLADVILFGSFLVWAVADRISMKSRTPRPRIAMPKTGFNDAISVVVGLGIYAAFLFWLHAKWIGVGLSL